VGGAVRDRLLGLPVQDRDWVVVGASPEEMLAAGYRPVGKDFPVFLHPQTQEEYALARTERKTAPGYKGFVFHTDASVRLEDDLIRRDLTINAMAEEADGSLIDPFGGQRDLAERVFRHVSPAFLEDPVRVLRLARFAARFPEFRVAPETLVLMQEMVNSGELDHLVPERVWQELARGLMYARPSRMFEVLRACGALARIMPELDRLFGIPQPEQYHPEVDTGIHTMRVVDYSAERNDSLPVRWAALLHDLGKGSSPPEEWPHHYGHEERGVALVEAVCARLKVPVECRDLAVLACREHGSVYKALEMKPARLASLLERLDVLRRPVRLEALLAVGECDFHGRLGFEDCFFAAPDLIRRAYAAFVSVDAGAVAQALEDKSQIPARLHEARSNAIRLVLGDTAANES